MDDHEERRPFLPPREPLSEGAVKKKGITRKIIQFLTFLPFIILTGVGVCFAVYAMLQWLGFGLSTESPNLTLRGCGTPFVKDLMKSFSLLFEDQPITFDEMPDDQGFSFYYLHTHSPSFFFQAFQHLIDGRRYFVVTTQVPSITFLEKNDIQVLPLAAGADAIGYNGNSIIPASMQITQRVLTSIYLGNISFWDDPLITKSNPNLTLPHEQIIPLHMTTTPEVAKTPSALFLSALCAFKNGTLWQMCNESSGDWQVQNPEQWETITDDRSMLEAIQNTPFSIGYLNLGHLWDTSLRKVHSARLQNKFGSFVRCDLKSLSASAQTSIWFLSLSNTQYIANAPITNSACEGCWPISGIVYISFEKDTLLKNCDYSKGFSQFLEWLYSPHAQRAEDASRFVTFDESTRNGVLDIIHAQSSGCSTNNFYLNAFTLSLLIGGGVFFVLFFGIGFIIWRLPSSDPQLSRGSRSSVSSLSNFSNPNQGPTLFSSNSIFRRSFDSGDKGSTMEILTPKSISIQDSELTADSIIGKGSYAVVYAGTWRSTEVAIKKIDKRLSSHNATNFAAEVEMMTLLRHPNVLLFLGAAKTATEVFIVTEYCSRGSLFHLIRNPEYELMTETKLSLMIDAARGMLYLHQHDPPIIHRDLKSSNLLIDKDWNTKVSDFGISTFMRSNARMMSGNMGTVEYMAPECLKNETYTEKCDVYSFSIVLCELFSDEELYQDMSTIQIRFQVRTQSLRPNLGHFVPAGLKELIHICWADKAEARPTFSHILERLITFQESPQSLHQLDPEPKGKPITLPRRIDTTPVSFLSLQEKEELATPKQSSI